MIFSALNDGVNVKGFFAAQLLDGFDWTDGYKTKYGLYHVEFGNKERIPKASASYYQKLIEHNGQEFSYPKYFVPEGKDHKCFTIACPILNGI